MRNLVKAVEIDKGLNITDGNSDRDGETIDTKGYRGVLIVVQVGTMSSGSTLDILAQHDDAIDGSGDLDSPTNISGAEFNLDQGSEDQSDELFIIDLVHPTKRYVRVKVEKDDSNNVTEGAVYMRYRGYKRPEVNTVDGEKTSELIVAPEDA